MNHEDTRTRIAIARALVCQSDLPGEIVTTVAALLKDGNIEVRGAAARILEKQSVLAEENGQSLAVVMDDPEDRKVTKHTDTFSGTADETFLFPAIKDEISPSPAIEDETSLSPATEDDDSLSSDTDDEIAESLINKATFSREEIKEVNEAFRERYWTYRGKLGRGKCPSSLHYENWLSLSFREQLVWYIEDGSLCLQYGEEL